MDRLWDPRQRVDFSGFLLMVRTLCEYMWSCVCGSVWIRKCQIRSASLKSLSFFPHSLCHFTSKTRTLLTYWTTWTSTSCLSWTLMDTSTRGQRWEHMNQTWCFVYWGSSSGVRICPWFLSFFFIFRTGCGGRTAPSAGAALALVLTSTETLTPTGAVSLPLALYSPFPAHKYHTKKFKYRNILTHIWTLLLDLSSEE